MSLTLQPLAYSEIGLVRKTNQDSGYVSDSMLLVADGMGGAAAGDLASAIAARELRHADDTAVPREEAADVLTTSLQAANTQIADLIAANPDFDGMGTTVSGGLFDGHTLTVIHLGDSRGYLRSGGQLRRITHDHSYVQSLIDEGRLGEREAMTHPHRSLLLKVLNGTSEIAPDLVTIDLAAGDRIMFCSDGLCGLVADPVIGAALNLADLGEVMETLVELAHAAGGTDNITIALADVVEAPPAPDPADVPGETGVTAQPSPPPEADATAQAAAQTTLPVSRYTTAGLIGAAIDPHIISLLARLGTRTTGTKPAPKSHRGDDPALTATAREKQRYTPTVRKSRKGFWLIAAAIVVVLGGGVWGVSAYVSSQYFIGDYQGSVAIFQGLPGNVAGISTSHLAETTPIALADLPISLRDQVTATIAVSSGGLDHAHATVAELQIKSMQCVAARAARMPGDLPPSDGC